MRAIYKSFSTSSDLINTASSAALATSNAVFRMISIYCFGEWVPPRDSIVVEGESMWKPVNDEISNAMGGKMSVMGLRPKQPGFEWQFAEEIPFYQDWRLVKLGITG